MRATLAKPISLMPVTALLAIAILSTHTPVEADTATWPELFVPTCHSGGCGSEALQCPQDITYSFPTKNSIKISAENTQGQTCLAISAYDKCRFLVGDQGVTQITFNFSITEACYSPASNIAWLSFWMRTQPYVSNAEVDFVESKHGPAVNGLNTNFDAHGFQVPIYCNANGDSTSPPCTPSSSAWTGSITATFSGSPEHVSVSVSNTVNTNVGTSTLTAGPTGLSNGNGYFMLMDIDPQGLVISQNCSITVSNLEVQGSIQSTIDGKANCVGLPLTPTPAK